MSLTLELLEQLLTVDATKLLSVTQATEQLDKAEYINSDRLDNYFFSFNNDGHLVWLVQNCPENSGVLSAVPFSEDTIFLQLDPREGLVWIGSKLQPNQLTLWLAPDRLFQAESVAELEALLEDSRPQLQGVDVSYLNNNYTYLLDVFVRHVEATEISAALVDLYRHQTEPLHTTTELLKIIEDAERQPSISTKILNSGLVSSLAEFRKLLQAPEEVSQVSKKTVL